MGDAGRIILTVYTIVSIPLPSPLSSLVFTASRVSVDISERLRVTVSYTDNYIRVHATTVSTSSDLPVAVSISVAATIMINVKLGSLVSLSLMPSSVDEAGVTLGGWYNK